jgi:cyanophycin synthetase
MLVDLQINNDPRRGVTEDSPLNALAPENSGEIVLELQRQGLTADAVPADGQKVLIQPNGNVSTDVTDLVHPSIAAAATLAARIVGLDIAGIDLVAEDISRPLDEQRGAFIEVNASPGLLAHLKPAHGAPRPIGAAIVKHLFAAGETGRIPVIGVTGTRGASMVARLIGCLLHLSGRHIGVANADGLYLDGRRVSNANSVRFDAGQRLLINRTVEAAVFESNARAILTEGLPYDKCQVGVVTDMHGVEDLAEFYLRDTDDLARVVRSQVDVVLPDGVAVLNAADAAVAELAELCDGSVIFYAADEHNSVMGRHRAAGERIVFVRAGAVVLSHGAVETVVIDLSRLMPEVAEDIGSVLAATAAGWALDVPADLLSAGLRTFEAGVKR